MNGFEWMNMCVFFSGFRG